MQRRPSALIVLGVYAGVIAAVAMLPAAIPLLYRLVTAEVRASTAEVYASTARIGHALERDKPVPQLPPHYVHAVTADGQLLLRQGTLSPEAHLEDLVCGEANQVKPVLVGDIRLTAGCYDSPRLRVFALWDPPARSYAGLGAFVAALAAVAGLVTALGVLQVLRPISRVSTALADVGTGRHGVRIQYTGMSELDELIGRLNATALAVEERENAIFARVRVVQEMARIVAHEIRNPLQSLELLTSLVAEESDPTERRELAANIHLEIRALDDVVTRLLREGAATGSLRLQVRPCEVEQLLEQIRVVRSAAAQRKGARIDLDAAGVGLVPLDRALFNRSIENLVANAIRAVPAKTGLVRVTARRVEELILEVSVEDNGPGVDPALGDRVFEPNVTGEEGHGLGLSLSKGVIEAHGGSIRFDRSDLGGARFVVQVPLHANAAESR